MSDVNTAAVSRLSEDHARRRFVRIAALAGLGMLAWLGFLSERSLQDFINATDLRYHAHRVLLTSQQLQYLLQESEAAQRAYLVTGDEVYLDPYHRALRAIPYELGQVAELSAEDSGQRDQVEALKPLLRSRMEELGREIQERRAGKGQVAENAINAQDYRQGSEQIYRIISTLKSDAEKLLAEEHTLALKNRQRLLYTFALVAILALVVIASLLIWHERDLRRQGIQALKESEERFVQVATMTGEWLWEQDANGRYTYSNASVTEILGFQPEEIIGKSYFEFFTKPEREKTIKSVYDTANKRDFVRLINHYRHKNGHEVVTESTGIPIFDERGLIVKWRGVDLDITAKQSAEVALQESEEKLRITFDNTPVGIATTDLDGRLVTTNPQFRKLFGYRPDDLIGAELWSLVDGEDAESLRRDWEVLVKGAPAKHEFEKRFRHQDGKLLVLRIRAAVARDAEGRPLAIVSEFEDLTERQRDLQEAVG